MCTDALWTPVNARQDCVLVDGVGIGTGVIG